MELQKIYKTKYVNYLSDNFVKEAYLQDKFIAENPQVLPLKDIYNNASALIEKMIPDSKHDFESAVALYEAYPNLTPLVASQASLWVYLAHNELFSYVQKRWKVSANSTEERMKRQWFDNGESGTLSGLWWAVYLTVDEDREDKYELTRTLFQNQTFRTRTFFTYRIGKCREALQGVLGFMTDNKELFKGHEEARATYVSLYFSRLGTTKELPYMDKEFFYNELNKKRRAIELAVDRENVRHNHEIWNI